MSQIASVANRPPATAVAFRDPAKIKPIHVAAYVEELQRTHSKPTVRQHLAALRMLFGC
jgi:hypothetical protein